MGIKKSCTKWDRGGTVNKCKLLSIPYQLEQDLFHQQYQHQQTIPFVEELLIGKTQTVDDKPLYDEKQLSTNEEMRQKQNIALETNIAPEKKTK